MDNSIVISTPPHVKSKRTTRSIMLDVCIALTPAAVAGCVFFGWQALLIILTSVFACVATEFVYYFIANKGFSNKCRDAKAVCLRWTKQFDFTSVVTGLILAMILPTTDKWYQVIYEVILGAVFAIAVVKMLFGGTGKNLVNPAAAGRVFMALSFTHLVVTSSFTGTNFGAVSDSSLAFTDATNLAGLLTFNINPALNPSSYLSTLDLFLGTGMAGCIGETCKLAIIIGYLYLCVRGVIKWWQPLLFLAVLGFTSVLIAGFSFDKYSFDMTLFLPYVLSGGAMFGAVFMLPDYVTSPKGVWGQLLYYIAAAVLLAVLRFFTRMEVISFVILLMNILTPLIDKYLIRRPFGYKKVKKQKEGK